MIRSFLLACALAFAVVGCGGSDEGAECASSDDCDDGLVCASLATCVGGDCPAICGRPCAEDADCAEGEICADTTGSSPPICQASREGIDF